jgi:predicted Zn-dependent peptidase
LVRFGYVDDYFDRYTDAVSGLDVEQVSDAARTLVRSAGLVWVVVGNRGQIEERARALVYGDIQILDADGNPVSE